MFKTDLCREYRIDNPSMPTLKLARIIYNDNKLLFPNVEAVRSALRGIEGKTGERNRAVIKDESKKAFFLKEDRPRNPYNLPESDEKPFEPFKLKGHKRLGILSDIHLPFHSVHAVTKAIEFCKKEKISLNILPVGNGCNSAATRTAPIP